MSSEARPSSLGGLVHVFAGVCVYSVLFAMCVFVVGPGKLVSSSYPLPSKTLVQELGLIDAGEEGAE